MKRQDRLPWQDHISCIVEPNSVAKQTSYELKELIFKFGSQSYISETFEKKLLDGISLTQHTHGKHIE